MMIRLIKYTILSIVYFPHILLFWTSHNRKCIMEDIRVNNYKNGFKELPGGGYNLVLQLVNNKYFRNLFYFRLGNKAKLVSWYCHPVPFFIISTKLGPGCYVAHPYSTTIFAKTIGRNFTCHQNTTIGVKYDQDNAGIPTLGDNVTIGCNVCIIGNIKIGNNVVVGAGTVVVKDISDNCVVAGNPAKILKVLTKDKNSI